MICSPLDLTWEKRRERNKHLSWDGGWALDGARRNSLHTIVRFVRSCRPPGDDRGNGAEATKSRFGAVLITLVYVAYSSEIPDVYW